MSGPTPSVVEDRLASLTLEETVAQLGTVRLASLLDDGAFSPAKADEHVADGVGRVTRVGRESDLDPADLAGVVADLQRYLCEETRPGIPAIVREESLCGYAGRGGTTFPQSIGMASTWDPALVERVADEIATQLRAVGCTTTLSPVADLGVEPRWGRVEETYGEDPTLAARMATATVEGLQGGESGVDATLKHFVGHGRPRGGLNRAPATASLAAMRDADLVPFRAAVEAGDARSVMAAYHAVDGVPCHASSALLTDLLRDEWGFDGTVVSDGRGIEQLCTDHGVASDRRAAGVLALEAGVDVELPETACFGDRLVDAVRDGAVEESRVTEAARRHLTQKARLGLLDGTDSPDAFVPEDPNAPFDDPRPRELARTAARRSVVLLTNDGTLPLSPDVERVAVVGPNADAPRNLLGNYAYGAAETMDGASDVVTPLDGLRNRLGADAVSYARGCGIRDGEDDDDVETAVARAADADVAVVCVGGKSGIDVERDSTGTAGEALDRSDLGLPGHQSALVDALARTDTPLVAVLVNGRPLAVPDVVARADAVVEAWLPGQEGGHAIADVLLGTDPGGRLPVTIPRSVGQLPVDYRRTALELDASYVFDDGDPLFPFGHGESYASFAYEDVSVDGEVPTDGTVAASVTVRNEGDVPGEEVVQWYVGDREASVVRPARELVAFERVRLDPGERVTVDVDLPADALAFHDVEGRLVVEPGDVEFAVGRSVGDVRATQTVTLVGEERYPDAPTFFADVSVR